MREFKFRAWWPTIQEIQYFDSIAFLNFEDDVLLYTKSPSEDPHGMDEIEDQIIMQYTGLKDKNGKEIYEGDIIKFERDTHLRGGGYRRTTFLSPVTYESNYGAFLAKYTDAVGDEMIRTLERSSIEKVEVVGNIYENPELLQS